MEVQFNESQGFLLFRWSAVNGKKLLFSICGTFSRYSSFIKKLLFGILNYEQILLTAAGNFIVFAVVFLLSRILFTKGQWVIGAC